MTSDLTIHPLTPERWGDFERLFGPQGAYAGCWCMWFRGRRKAWAPAGGGRRREARRAIAESGEPPGLLAYVGGEPAGWVSLGPRTDFPHLEHSRTLKRIDDRPAWSIAC